jgi:hypothetical protein
LCQFIRNNYSYTATPRHAVRHITQYDAPRCTTRSQPVAHIRGRSGHAHSPARLHSTSPGTVRGDRGHIGRDVVTIGICASPCCHEFRQSADNPIDPTDVCRRVVPACQSTDTYPELCPSCTHPARPAEPAKRTLVTLRRLIANHHQSDQSPTLRLPFICEAGQKLTCRACVDDHGVDGRPPPKWVENPLREALPHSDRRHAQPMRPLLLVCSCAPAHYDDKG